jgi:hypothetical protein
MVSASFFDGRVSEIRPIDQARIIAQSLFSYHRGIANPFATLDSCTQIVDTLSVLAVSAFFG